MTGESRVCLFVFEMKHDMWGFYRFYDREFREPLVWPHGSPVSIRVERGCAALLSNQGMGIGPQDALKGESRGLSRVAAGNPEFPRLVMVNSGRFWVPMGRQEYCGVVRGLSGPHWVWCNGRGPHLELRREPQGSFSVLTWVLGCVCHFKQGVRSLREWRHGTLLYSRVVKGVSGLHPR